MDFLKRLTSKMRSTATAAAGNKGTGAFGEELAADFISAAGYRVLQRNFRCKGGEVDIIANDPAEKCLVFIEVKTRRGQAYGVPQLAVTPFKQRQISKAALTWLSINRRHDHNARFDVIAILLHNGAPHTIDHIKNAFDLAY